MWPREMKRQRKRMREKVRDTESKRDKKIRVREMGIELRDSNF